jgi:hypothetical protein
LASRVRTTPSGTRVRLFTPNSMADTYAAALAEVALAEREASEAKYKKAS